ncbi:MAG: methyltransferase domain-containing protein [Verrucomicrobiota bacterium]
MSDTDSSQPDFWDQRWEADRLPWDLGHTPGHLEAFLQQLQNPGRVLIPGCGSGYEVKCFHDAGHDVIAIDFCESAVAHARKVLGPLGDKVRQGDFFKHECGETRYDFIYERGFLCSLPPSLWQDYAARMSHLLAPGGKLFGLFLYGDEPEPPPYPLQEKTARDILGKHFRLTNTTAVEVPSVPVYQGMEYWQQWENINGAGI